MTRALLGAPAEDWLQLAQHAPPEAIRLVLSDIDGVITPGEGQPTELDVLAELASFNRRARDDAAVPAVTLCTGRQAPYVELMAQMTETFLPCIFEHGAGLFFPGTYRFTFDERLGADYPARLARLRAALEPTLLRPGRAFVQPGKEATMSLYPLEGTSLDELAQIASEIVARSAPAFDVERNVHGVELRPHGIDKGLGFERIKKVLGLAPAHIAGVGDSDPDLSFLRRCGFSAAPANASSAVQAGVRYVAQDPFGRGLLEILRMIAKHNRDAI